ncbi:MAG: adhP [Deltaproteobacteria bacterium]|nr:adhP [Deltaproteobacteria bacterium]
MQALIWDGVTARVTDQPPPRPAAGMALLRVMMAGICNTDLEIIKGYMNFRGVLGHEFVGLVEDGPTEWRHKRVVADINFACGSCPLCARQLGRHCFNRTVMGILGADGAFAEMIAVPVANLHLVPEAVSTDAAVFTEPLAAAFEILEQVHLQPGTEAVVLGDGKLGLLVAQVLHQAGAQVLAVGKHDDKLAVLRRHGIETCTLDRCGSANADVVVDASGSSKGFAAAVRMTRPRGTLVLKSTVAEPSQLNLAPLVINEITLVGSRCGRLAPALRALAQRRIDVASLISARFPLRDGEQALRAAASPGTLKVLLEITPAGTAATCA